MTYPTAADVRVQIQGPPVGLANLVPNPSGALGAWGWLTPIDGTRLVRDTTYGFPTLKTVSDTGGANVINSEMFAANGAWAAVRLQVHRLDDVGATGTDSFFRVYYYDVTDSFVGASPLTYFPTITPSSAGTTVRIGAHQPPATAVTAQVQFYIDGLSDGGTRYTIPFQFSGVCLATAETSAALANLPILEPAPWVTITDAVSQVVIDREAASASTATVVVPNATYDLPTNPLIRPGRALRVQARTTAGDWEPLFTGTIDVPLVDYDLLNENPVERTVVTFTATDALPTLANFPRVAGIMRLLDYSAQSLLEGAGVPWNVYGNVDQDVARASAADSENATLLDQLVLARNGTFAFQSPYFWVGRDGVLYLGSGGIGGAYFATGVTLTETDYDQAPSVTFDPTFVVNSLTITNRAIVGGETVEIVRGPFRDRRSIRQWGLHHLDVQVQGYNTERQYQLLADDVLAANGNARVRMNTVRIAIQSNADVIRGKALTDMYDVIRVTNTDRAIDQSDRVLRVTHTITPGSDAPWVVDLVFAAAGTLARSRPVPSLNS